MSGAECRSESADCMGRPLETRACDSLVYDPRCASPVSDYGQNQAMTSPIHHIHPRELRFLGLLLITALVIALQLADGLRLAGLTGSGWRVVDRQALERRIGAGDLSDREAVWYHPATPEETRAAGSGGEP